MLFLIRYLSIFLLCAPVLAAAMEGRDPYTYFFNPHTGDLKVELADAKKAAKRAVFLMFEQEGCPGCIHMKEHVLLGEFVASGAYKTRKFAEFKQTRTGKGS